MRKLACEFIATAGLLMAVVGSGIMAERLAQGNLALALLANTMATGAALLALILTFGPISGAHMNPVISLAAAINGDSPWRVMLSYIPVQIAGAVIGVIIANVMFDLPAVFTSTKVRTGLGQWLGETVATFGLVGVVILTSRSRKP